MKMTKDSTTDSKSDGLRIRRFYLEKKNCKVRIIVYANLDYHASKVVMGSTRINNTSSPFFLVTRRVAIMIYIV